MSSSHSRNNTLKKIAEALTSSTKLPFAQHDLVPQFFNIDQDNHQVLFVQEFERVGGQVFLCSSVDEVLDYITTLAKVKAWDNIACETTQLLDDFNLRTLPFVNNENCDEIDAGITDCEILIARTGTVLLSSAQPSGRVFPVHTPVHIIIAYENQLVGGFADAFSWIRNRFADRLPSALFFASGPSRTGDIEKTLVAGVHGPKEVLIFLMTQKLIDNSSSKRQ
jgi:L-lactate dehydrogenase complex protein LldG